VAGLDAAEVALEFDALWAFVLLPAPLLVWWLLPAYREREESVRVPFFEGLAGATGVTPSHGGVLLTRNLAQWVLAPLVWGLVVFAMARPQLVEPPIERVESARDLMLAVDLSGSMETRDMFDPEGARISRLEAVKLVLDDFIARRAGDRLGIIVFGTQAFVQTPFTIDHDLVRTLLEQTRPGLPGQQTMIGDALGLTVKTFEPSDADDRLLVLLTDGNDTGSKIPPRKAAEIVAAAGITVHTVAIGDPESAGEAEMDLETLGAIAAATGGAAFQADDRDQLEGVYRRIDALTPVEVETISYRPTRPLFHWPLGAALLLVLLYHAGMAVATGVGRVTHA
jgi:Ca-activated chloride channel family protein